jgi:hypothetical protein
MEDVGGEEDEDAINVGDEVGLYIRGLSRHSSSTSSVHASKKMRAKSSDVDGLEAGLTEDWTRCSGGNVEVGADAFD